MSCILRALVSRATQLTAICAASASRGFISLDAIHNVSSLAYALCVSTARFSLVNSSNSEPFVSAAKTACSDFLTLLEVLPSEERIPSEVFVNALRCMNRGLSFLPVQTVLYPLLLRADAHFDSGEIGNWIPRDLLAALYAMAMIKPSLTLPFLPNLLHCTRQHLQSFGGKELALLLWSLAALEQEKEALWDKACQRCLAWYKKMNPSSRVMVLQAILLCKNCTCDAQQQLLNLVKVNVGEPQGDEEDLPFTLGDTEDDSEGRNHPRSTMEVGFASRSGMRSRWDPLEGVGSYQNARLQLFRSARVFSVETLLQITASAWTYSRTSENTKSTEQFLADEVLLLLEHLSHKRLSAAQGVRLLYLLDAHDVFHDSSYNELPKLQPVQAAVLRAIGGITESNVDAIENKNETLYVLLLCWQIIAVEKPPVVSPLLALSMSLSDKKRAELMDFILDLNGKCHEQVSKALNSIDGRMLWVLALSASWAQEQYQRVITSSNLDSTTNNEREAKIQSIITQMERITATCLNNWRQNNISSAFSPPEECVDLITASCQTHYALRSLFKSSSSFGNNLLLACVDLVRGSRNLNWAVLSRLLAALESVRKENAPSFPPALTLLGLGEHLIQQLEVVNVKQNRKKGELLQEVERFLHVSILLPEHAGETASRTPWISTSYHVERSPSRVPDALLDIYIRLLMDAKNSTGMITEHQARLLVQCVESRARCGVEELEKAFMLLCTPRFGFQKSLLEEVRLPPLALTRLVELAAVLYTSRIPTSTTILSALFHELIKRGISECADISSLNGIASLLLLPVCSGLGVKERLVEGISQHVIELSEGKGLENIRCRAKKDHALEKAYLVAYLVRANALVSEKLLSALRQPTG